jgi:hypothetical protein
MGTGARMVNDDRSRTDDKPDPLPDADPDQPVRGARWAHETVAGRSRHDKAARSGLPESAVRSGERDSSPADTDDD